jgi:hypothetical protein
MHEAAKYCSLDFLIKTKIYAFIFSAAIIRFRTQSVMDGRTDGRMRELKYTHIYNHGLNMIWEDYSFTRQLKIRVPSQWKQNCGEAM